MDREVPSVSERPMMPAMSERAVVDEHPRAAGTHHSRAGLHHRPGRQKGTTGTAQENVDGVAVDGRQFVFGWWLRAGGNW